MRDCSRDFSLYIHVPFCTSKCAYCDFLSFTDHSCMEAYFRALYREIEVKSELYPRAVDNIYIGGGTPSVAYRYLPELGERLRRAFPISKEVEISVECNPESVTPDFVAAAKAAGVNRVSVGVQSLSDRLLKRIGRAHDREKALSALALLTDNFPSVGADMMVGLPDQGVADVASTLDGLLAFPLDHVSCYSLIYEEGTPLYREARAGEIAIDEDHEADLYDFAVERLASAGYDRYEISNFCRNEAICRYNTSVWQYGDYIGLGLGSSSFAKGNIGGFVGRRYRNASNLVRYITANGMPRMHAEKIDREEGKREFVMLGLRQTAGISLPHFRELFGTDYLTEYRDKINPLRKYLTIGEDSLAIKPEYLYVSNSIIVELIF